MRSTLLTNDTSSFSPLSDEARSFSQEVYFSTFAFPCPQQEEILSFSKLSEESIFLWESRKVKFSQVDFFGGT